MNLSPISTSSKDPTDTSKAVLSIFQNPAEIPLHAECIISSPLDPSEQCLSAMLIVVVSFYKFSACPPDTVTVCALLSCSSPSTWGSVCMCFSGCMNALPCWETEQSPQECIYTIPDRDRSHQKTTMTPKGRLQQSLHVHWKIISCYIQTNPIQLY